MSLKTYLEAFGKAASHNAVFNPEAGVTITPSMTSTTDGKTATMSTFTMPFDGLVRLYCVPTNATLNEVVMRVNSDRLQTNSNTTTASAMATGFIVAKGASVEVFGRNITGLSIVIRQLIGGG